MFDPCSYPGVQSKFYYKKDCKDITQFTGNKTSDTDGNLSFMIFRTGSVLIVGNCNEDILSKVYLFIKNILENEFDNVNSNIPFVKKNKVKKQKLKKLTIYTTE